MTCSLRPRNLATYCFISVRLYLLTVHNENNFTEMVRTPSTNRIYMQWRVHLAKNLTFVTKRSFTFLINKWHIYSTLSRMITEFVCVLNSFLLLWEPTCLLHLAIYESFITVLLHFILSLFLFLCECEKNGSIVSYQE